MINYNLLLTNLVRVSETTHTRHDAEDVVVDRENIACLGRTDKLGVVNAGEGACSRWLVFCWFEGKRGNSNAVGGSTYASSVSNGSRTSVVHPYLLLGEIIKGTSRHAVVTVKFELVCRSPICKSGLYTISPATRPD